MTISLEQVTPESICLELARLYSGRDWHALPFLQQKLVRDLEAIGYLIPNDPANGFVGKAVS